MPCSAATRPRHTTQTSRRSPADTAWSLLWSEIRIVVDGRCACCASQRSGSGIPAGLAPFSLKRGTILLAQFWDGAPHNRAVQLLEGPMSLRILQKIQHCSRCQLESGLPFLLPKKVATQPIPATAFQDDLSLLKQARFTQVKLGGNDVGYRRQFVNSFNRRPVPAVHGGEYVPWGIEGHNARRLCS